jgi:hypothetical protein
MINSPDLMENLVLSNDVAKADRINNGFKIQGKGTFKFTIANNDSRMRTICIPNSLYLPGLKN